MSETRLQSARAVMTRRFAAGVMAAAALMALPACAGRSAYMGIPLTAGQADMELQQLANRARAGDKQAQLELGIRFEEGRGVPVDVIRATELYRAAASGSGGTMWVYSPPVGNGTKGRVVPVGIGSRRAGLGEAKARLDALVKLQKED